MPKLMIPGFVAQDRAATCHCARWASSAPNKKECTSRAAGVATTQDQGAAISPIKASKSWVFLSDSSVDERKERRKLPGSCLPVASACGWRNGHRISQEVGLRFRSVPK